MNTLLLKYIRHVQDVAGSTFIPGPAYVWESEYPSGVEFTAEEKRLLIEADAEVLRLLMAESATTRTA